MLSWLIKPLVVHFGGAVWQVDNYCTYISEAHRYKNGTIMIISQLTPHSHGGAQHLLHHQHLLHLLSGGDRGSSTKRLPLVPAVRVPGPEAVRADCAPRRGAWLQGPGPHRRRPLHRKAPQRHPQPVQAPTAPQGQELWWCVPGNNLLQHIQHTLIAERWDWTR